MKNYLLIAIACLLTLLMFFLYLMEREQRILTECMSYLPPMPNCEGERFFDLPRS